MKLSYRTINDNMFMQALRSLGGQRMPSKVAYDIAKICRAVEKTVAEAKPQFRKIMEQVAERDEKGGFIPADDGNGIKIKEDKWEEYEKLMAEFLSREIEVDWRPIYIGHLEHTNLAPQEIEALTPILTEMHVVP